MGNIFVFKCGKWDKSQKSLY